MKQFWPVLVFILSCNCFGQTLSDVKKLEDSYQKCLDRGTNMKQCSVDFYERSDSLLNVVYKNLELKLVDRKQIELKNQQRLWLRRKEVYFRKAYQQTKEIEGITEGTQDFDMIYIDAKSQFVMDRVKELIKLL